MLIIISPAKKLDFDSKVSRYTHTQPALLDKAIELVGIMKGKSVTDLQSLMGISPKLAELNVGRYQQFSFPFTPDNAKPALYAFQGDVYANIDTDSYTEEDDQFAQQHLRILSGLYGLLRPLDLMQPYRLEMGTKLRNPEGEDLYDFWGDLITNEVNTALAEQGDDIVLNLASQEYAKSFDAKHIKGRVIDVEFKEYRDGKYKTIGLLAKRARGLCTDYVIRHRISDLAGLKSFDQGGYLFNPDMSTDSKIFFSR